MTASRRKTPGAYGIRESERPEVAREATKNQGSTAAGIGSAYFRSQEEERRWRSLSLSLFFSLEGQASWLPSKVESARQRVARPSSWDVDQPRQTCGMQHTYTLTRIRVDEEKDSFLSVHSL